MTASERKRVERDLMRCMAPRLMSEAELTALTDCVLRERAAAFEAAEQAVCEAGKLEKPLRVRGDAEWATRSHVRATDARAIRAIAAQEREQAGEGGGRG